MQNTVFLGGTVLATGDLYTGNHPSFRLSVLSYEQKEAKAEGPVHIKVLSRQADKAYFKTISNQE